MIIRYNPCAGEVLTELSAGDYRVLDALDQVDVVRKQAEKARQDNFVAIAKATNDVGGQRERHHVKPLAVEAHGSGPECPTYERKMLVPVKPCAFGSTDNGGYRERRKT